MLRPFTSPVRLIASLIFLLTLTSCFQAEPVQPGGLEPTQADPFEVFEEDIASIKLSPDSIIAEPGETYTLDAVYLDSEENVLGLVDPAQVNVNVSGEGYSASFDAPGSLTLSVPTSISTGHVGVSLKSNEQVYGVTGASVVATKAGVTTLADASVIFPRTDYDFSGMSGEEIGAYLFDPFTEAEFEQTVSENLDEAPLFPVVLEGATNLTSGDLITGTGGAFLYGRVEKVVAQRGGRTLLAVKGVFPDEIYTDYTNEDIQDLQDSDVLPQVIELDDIELNDVEEDSEVTTQANAPSCSLRNMTATAKVKPLIAEKTLSVDAELSIKALGEFNGSCSLFYERPLPIFGVASFLIFPQIRVGGKMTLNVTADRGEFEPDTFIQARGKVQLLPKFEHLETPAADFSLDPVPVGNWQDVNGIDGYLRATGELAPQVGIELLLLGVVGKTLDLIEGKIKATKYADILKILNRYGTAASGEVYLQFKPTMTAQWATMKSALNNASSKMDTKYEIIAGARLANGWLVEQLKKIYVGLDVGVPITWKIDPDPLLLGPLTASTTSDDGEGNPSISVTNSGNYPLTKVQLGNLAQNSLHGDVTGPSGGAVTYGKDECDGANSLEAKVLAIADTPFFPLGAPFNSQQVVSVCEGEEEGPTHTKRVAIGLGGSAPSGQYRVENGTSDPDCGNWVTPHALSIDRKTIIASADRYDSPPYPTCKESSADTREYKNGLHQSWIPVVVADYEEKRLSERQCIVDPYKEDDSPWYYATLETYADTAPCK